MQIKSVVWRALRTYATQITALILVGATLVGARQPVASRSERLSLSSSFRFARMPVDVDKFAIGPLRQTRQVHPSLERISSWISGTGAAATSADLDGDGLPNDLCLVDPRVDRLVVLPVPGTPQRYPAFALDCTPLIYNPDTMSPTGSVVGDFNEDGRPDILVLYWGRTPVLFLRRENTAWPVQPSASDFVPRELVDEKQDGQPLRWFTHAGTQADVDGDGHLDLVLGNFFQDGADILNARGTGIATVMHAGKSKATNGGGAKMFLWQSANSGSQPEVVYRNVTEVLEKLCGHGWVLALGAADLDFDGLPEIYLAHDFGPDRLLYNRSRPGQPEFQVCEGVRDFTTPKSCVLGRDSCKGMGIDFADVNGDGFFDIYVSNIADEWALQETHFLWLSTGHPELLPQGVAPYVHGSERLGLSRSGWGWDCKFADFNNDGVLEAIQATGFVRGKVNRWPELQALGTSNDRIIHDPRFWPRFQPGADLSGQNLDAFFVRGKSGRFVNIGTEVGLEEPLNTRGIAIDDVDGDGRLDFVTANQWGPSYVFRNESPSQDGFLGLHLLLPLASASTGELRHYPGHPRPDLSVRPAIGAVAYVRLPDGRQLMALADGGTAHSGRRSPNIHFGLGDVPQDQTVAVELLWSPAAGSVQKASIRLTPGWHTVVLGPSASEKTP